MNIDEWAMNNGIKIIEQSDYLEQQRLFAASELITLQETPIEEKLAKDIGKAREPAIVYDWFDDEDDDSSIMNRHRE